MDKSKTSIPAEVLEYMQKDIERFQMDFSKQLDEYIDHIKKESRDLQELIFSWRIKFKDQLFAEMSFHQPEQVTDEMILKEVNDQLEEFDNHFGITVSRYGSTDN